MNLEIQRVDVAMDEIRMRDQFEVTIALGQILCRVLALRHHFQASTYGISGGVFCPGSTDSDDAACDHRDALYALAKISRSADQWLRPSVSDVRASWLASDSARQPAKAIARASRAVADRAALLIDQAAEFDRIRRGRDGIGTRFDFGRRSITPRLDSAMDRLRSLMLESTPGR